MADKKYHYLAATEVSYRKRHMADKHSINVLLVLDNPEITQHILGHIQQVAQIRFFKGVHEPSPDLLIDDIFIVNIIPLGHMTEEQFLAKPETKQDAVQKIIKEALASAPTPEPPQSPPKADPPVPVAEEPVDAPVAPEATPAPVQAPQAVEPPYLDIDPPDTKSE